MLKKNIWVSKTKLELQKPNVAEHNGEKTFAEAENLQWYANLRNAT